MKTPFIFLCAALLLVASCGKLGKTTAEGRVIHNASNDGIFSKNL